MTFSKYKRLFLVLLLPLLCCGFVLSLLSPFRSEYSVVCETVFKAEICKRTRGAESTEYKVAKANYRAPLFTVQATEPDAFIRPLVEASPRLLSKVQIVGFTPYNLSGTPEASSAIQAMTGRTGSLQLGVPPSRQSTIEANDFLIYCTELDVRSPGDTYESVCSGKDWQGRLKFTALEQSQEVLQALRAAVNRELDRKTGDFVGYAALVYPFFVYLFLLVSLLVYFASKVRRGAKP
ncbi:hypothetical protein [Variovorax sp. W2I14]|uniref:hypothetical protein n=1 Tax=Variovorax sp. W2I14 TaxID=3042290 RepID=UPI003D1C1206